MRRIGTCHRYGSHGPHGSPRPGSSTLPCAFLFTGLHGMTLLVVLLLMLASCGIAGAALPPAGYVWTTSTELDYLTWNPNNGQLVGTSTSMSYADTQFANSTTPDVFTMGYSGTQNGTTVQLSVHSLFDATISGTQSSDGQTLTLGMPDPTTGQITQERWVAVSPQQESALLAAFTANEVVRGLLPVVQQNAHEEPTPWTDQNAGGIAEVQSEVQQDQGMLQIIQQARDETTQCQDVQAFQGSNLLAPAAFTFSYAIGDAPLMTHLGELEQAWKQAEQHPIPQIAGLPAAKLPWAVTSAQYQAGTRAAMQIAAHITASKQHDITRLEALWQQYQVILHTEQAIAKSCPGV